MAGTNPARQRLALAAITAAAMLALSLAAAVQKTFAADPVAGSGPATLQAAPISAAPVSAGDAGPPAPPAGPAKSPTAPRVQRDAMGAALPLPVARTIQEGLDLTEEEKEALAAINQRPDQFDETGLYVMLRRVAALPRLDPEKWADELDMPSYKNLNQFQGRPLHIKANLAQAYKVIPGHQSELSYSPFWPRGRAVWVLDCIVPLGNDYFRQPLRVFSVVEPPSLPPPQKTEKDLALYIQPGPEIDVAGVFYKTYRGEDREGHRQQYPIIIAWQIERETLQGTGLGPFNPLNLALGLLAVLAVGYLFLRSYLRNAAASRTSKYKPLREEAQPQAAQDEEPQAVDPLLQAAAEEYDARKRAGGGERQGKDGASGQS